MHVDKGYLVPDGVLTFIKHPDPLVPDECFIDKNWVDSLVRTVRLTKDEERDTLRAILMFPDPYADLTSFVGGASKALLLIRDLPQEEELNDGR